MKTTAALLNEINLSLYSAKDLEKAGKLIAEAEKTLPGIRSAHDRKLWAVTLEGRREDLERMARAS